MDSSSTTRAPPNALHTQVQAEGHGTTSGAMNPPPSSPPAPPITSHSQSPLTGHGAQLTVAAVQGLHSALHAGYGGSVMERYLMQERGEEPRPGVIPG